MGWIVVVFNVSEPKEKGQTDKQGSTKHTYKTKDRATETSLKPRMNSGFPKE
jgi:hypothetical protein